MKSASLFLLRLVMIKKRRLYPSIRNWPDRSILILSDAHAQGAMDMHKGDLRAYDQLKTLAGSTAKAISWFLYSFLVHIFILALNSIFICFFFIILVHLIMFLIVFVSPPLL